MFSYDEIEDIHRNVTAAIFEEEDNDLVNAPSDHVT